MNETIECIHELKQGGAKVFIIFPSGGKLSIYSTFKAIFKREDYLYFSAKFSDRRIITRFRIGSHKLENLKWTLP